MTFGQLIREARERLGKSQSDAAGDLGVGQPVLSRWENDRQAPDPRTLPTVIDHYGLTHRAANEALAQSAELRERVRAEERRIRDELTGDPKAA